MQTSAALHNLESAIEAQLALVADPAVEAGGRAVLAALRPALKEAAMELANQATEEVAAQLPAYRVELFLADGEPSIRVSADESTATSVEGDFDARITLRLPPAIKDIVERAASESGDSVNAWVVKTLAGKVHGPRTNKRRIVETLDI
ncbi:MAG TPA: toxin-antitoxin system HicB family antitoxin [Acidimicrobiia bacterium]|nr:toxin-antitoxin system HicB family antitoxin [Acidimicrobiia bacterium]